MNRSGRESTEGSTRETCRIFAVFEEPVEAESGGIYRPDSRNDLMLPILNRDDADGESRMIGSGRRPAFFDWTTAVWLDGCGTTGSDCLLRLRPRKTWADFRTCEKS